MTSGKTFLVAAAALGAVCCFADAVSAQQSAGGSTSTPTSVTPLTGSSNSSSRTSTGGTSSSMGTSGTSSFGSTGSTTSSSSSGGTGGSGSQGGGASAGQLGPQFNAGDGSLGQQMMQGAFAGSQASQFVGSQIAGGQTGQQAGRGRTQQPQFNAFGGGNYNNFNNFGQNQMGMGTRILPRPQLQIGFNFPAPSATAVAVNAAAVLQNAQSLPAAQSRFPGVSVSVGGSGAVTLAGNVPDEQSRQLAEILVRLEPGVRDVNNQLSIASGVYAPAPAGP